MITSYADIKIISSLTVAKVFLSVGLHLFCLEWKITFKLDYKFLFNPQALSLHPLHFIVLVYFCFLSYECLQAWFFFFFGNTDYFHTAVTDLHVVSLDP